MFLFGWVSNLHMFFFLREHNNVCYCLSIFPINMLRFYLLLLLHAILIIWKWLLCDLFLLLPTGKPSLSRTVKFVCEEDKCQATFADQKGFFDHFLYHYTNSSATCDFSGCTESFRNMITMSRHTKCHYGEKKEYFRGNSID